VLINCMEFSYRRVTTALSVHGTTVIPQGTLVNDILYNERNDQLLLRQDKGLCCINLDGHVIYRYSINTFLKRRL
jgi:hypothetical protein